MLEYVQKQEEVIRIKKVITFFLVLAIASIAVACADRTSAEPMDTNRASTEPLDFDPGSIVDLDGEQAQRNTDGMVDGIIIKAREDAKTVTDGQLETAIKFIQDTYPEYFTDNATMEKTIYCGALLDYACREKNQVLSDLGTDAIQVVKYVYRGYETIDDQATQANLEQIKKGLTEAGRKIEE